MSFPGLRQCKKCGFSLESSPGKSAAIRSAWDDLESAGSVGGPQFVSSSPRASQPAEHGPGSSSDRAATSTARGGSLSGPPPGPASAQPQETVKAGSGSAGELSDRVSQFRRRGEAAPGPPEREFSLPLKWEAASQQKRPGLSSPYGETSKPQKPNLDVAFGERGASESNRKLESFPLSGRHASSFASEEAQPIIVPRPRVQSPPAYVLESDFSETTPIPASDFAEVQSAPLGKRFWAGVVDGLVLFAADCIFAIAFWVAGGRIQPGPLNLGILLVIIAFWLFAYFAAFTTLTLSTPGQAMMGLWVRNFDGEHPTRQECLLRAFGYLVSIASVMLGFLWAAMDSDGLAWHDHISGTLLSERDSGTAGGA